MSVSSGGNSCVVPDAVFGLEYLADGDKSYRFFALEADRGTMPVARSSLAQSSYHKKLIAYREIIARQLHRTYLGLPNLFVLTVTTCDAHKVNMLAGVQAVTGDGNAMFMFKSIGRDDRPNRTLLVEPWDRAGHQPFCIAKPI